MFDQALYAKPAEIIWKHTSTCLAFRMGYFHRVMNVLSITGTCFHDAGLRELAVESGFTAEGSV